MVDVHSDIQGVLFELGAGPVVMDNNVLIGPGWGTSSGIVAQDHSGANLGHNLVFKFGGAAVDLHGLTGRQNSPMKDWWLGGNMMFSNGYGPWLRIHKRKVIGDIDAIQNETAQHNLIMGGEPVYPPNQPGNLNITVSLNQNVSGSAFAVDVDREEMTLRISPIEMDECLFEGPGNDIDFLGNDRSSSKCVPGPVGDLMPGQPRNLSLWPVGGSWPQ